MKQEKLTALLLDVVTQEVSKIEIKDELQAFYDAMHCDMIEIHPIRVGTSKKVYDCICDEEGTFKADPRISAIDPNFNPQFVGSLLVVGTCDNEGDLQSLEDGDFEYLKTYTKKYPTEMHPEGNVMLTNVRMQ